MTGQTGDAGASGNAAGPFFEAAMLHDDDLSYTYPHYRHPIRCENGCGAVVELIEAFSSYKRTSDVYGKNRPLLICECCAAEEGHMEEDREEPEESPVCRRKPKVHLTA